MAKLAELHNLFPALREFVKMGKPVWGTCAGLIFLANKATGQKEGGQELVGGLDCTIQSFEAEVPVPDLAAKEGGPPSFRAVFIRAPAILEVGPDVEVLASISIRSTDIVDPSQEAQPDTKVIVAVKQGNLLATAFHPELTIDSRWHSYFVKMSVGNNEIVASSSSSSSYEDQESFLYNKQSKTDLPRDELLFSGKMAKEQKAESGRSKKGETAPATAKANGKRKIKKNAEGDVQVEVPIVQSSSSNSHNHERNGVKSESFVEEQVEVSGKVDVVDDSVEAEEAMKSTEASKEEKKKEKAKEEEVKEDTHQKKKKKVKEEIDEKDSSSLYQIPMNRVSRIIKVEDPNVRITQEAVFIINKASEKFLQLFTTEAYASAFLDRKKHIGYKHLSSVVGKRRRFDFLSDFVPEKVKAEDALKETPAVET
uniref:Transcription factor CBF/NF-Y/archaeal histone domain-containing protein n=2 Tax=Lactuca sativa TaxID=4236 RepID=A0A9R1XY69_LACSA|nr:hypothetical protein LSAT_V11C100026290 [Lactuca sativa]